MKSPIVYRPARRIPAARLERMRAASAAKKQAREDAYQQRINPTPEFEAAPRLSALPGGLHWSNKAAAVPAIGATITVNRDGHTERAKVAAYCHAAGFLGLITETTHHPKGSSRKARTARAKCVFSHQLAHAA